MPGPFSQTVIAVVRDFDKTLIPGNTKTPLFEKYGVDERAFWDGVDGLRDFYLAHGARRVADDALYLNHILEYVRAGAFKGLSNATLTELGAELIFHSGIPEFLGTLRESVEDDPAFQRADITLEQGGRVPDGSARRGAPPPLTASGTAPASYPTRDR